MRGSRREYDVCRNARSAQNAHTLTERLALMEAVLHLTREELQQRPQQLLAQHERTAGLATAAQALIPDYTTDTELANFTVLDSAVHE